MEFNSQLKFSNFFTSYEMHLILISATFSKILIKLIVCSALGNRPKSILQHNFNIKSWNLIQNWNFRIFLQTMRSTKFYLLLFFENSDEINFSFWTWKSTKNYIAAQFDLISCLTKKICEKFLFNINSWNLIHNWNFRIFSRGMRLNWHQILICAIFSKFWSN